MSPTLHQLTELGRTALQRLQQSGDCTWMLFQAEGALLPHVCSSVQNLLHPLSLSQDSNLNRIVAAQVEPDPTVPATVERMEGQSIQLTPPAAPSPAAARPVFPPSAHHIRSLDPVVGHDSPRGRQLVRELLDRHNQESFPLGKAQQEGPRHSLSVPEQVSIKAPQKIPPPKTTISANRDDHATKAIRHKGLSPPFSEIVPESGPRDWFSCHPGHREAAASVLTPITVPGIDQPALRSWSQVPVAQRAMLAGNPSPLTREADRPDSTAAASSSPRTGSPQYRADQETSFTSRFGQAAPTSKSNVSPSQSAPASPTSMTVPHPGSASAATSQLELLVQKWQESKAAPGNAPHPTNLRPGGSPPGPPAPGALSPLPSPRQNPTVEEASAPETTVGRESGGKGLFTQAGLVSEEFFNESSSFTGEPVMQGATGAQPRADLETDRLFAETLARVLHREIRRHGLEEQP